MDFIAKFNFPDEDNLTNEAPRDERFKLTVHQLKKGGGVGVVITAPDGEILKYGVQLKFPAINNKAKYEGKLTGLRLGKAFGVKNLLV